MSKIRLISRQISNATRWQGYLMGNVCFLIFLLISFLFFIQLFSSNSPEIPHPPPLLSNQECILGKNSNKQLNKQTLEFCCKIWKGENGKHKQMKIEDVYRTDWVFFSIFGIFLETPHFSWLLYFPVKYNCCVPN